MQKSAAINAVRASPISSGYSVHQNLGNMGPEMQVGNDRRSRASLNLLVLKERGNIMHRETRGEKMEDNVGAMVDIGEQLLLSNIIKKQIRKQTPIISKRIL